MNDEGSEEQDDEMIPSTSYYMGQDISFIPISREEERELFRKVKAGDEEARTFLITNHLLFAKTEAKKIGKGAEEDELTSAANLALMTAVDQFDLAFKSRFTSYLRPFIWGEVARLWRSKNIVGSPRHITPPKTVYLEDFSGDVSGDGDHNNQHHRRDADIASRLLHACPLDEEKVVENFDFLNLDNETTFRIVWDIAEKKLTEYEFSIFKAVYREGLNLSEIARKRKVSRQAIQQARNIGMAKITAELRRRRLLK